MSVTADAQMLRAVFGAVATQADTVRIVPSEEGWSMFARSADNVSMVGAEIPKESFDGYEVWGVTTVDCKDILEPLAKAKGPAVLDISTGRLVVKAGGMRFVRALQAEYEELRSFRMLEFAAEAAVPMASLAPLLSAPVDRVRWKSIAIRIDEEGVSMEVSEDDQDIGAVSMDIPAADCLVLSGEGRAVFSAERVFQVLGAIPRDAEADISLSTDYPMMVSFAVNGAQARFMLAPRIEVE